MQISEEKARNSKEYGQGFRYFVNWQSLAFVMTYSFVFLSFSPRPYLVSRSSLLFLLPVLEREMCVRRSSFAGWEMNHWTVFVGVGGGL